jgi:hypothetical protein
VDTMKFQAKATSFITSILVDACNSVFWALELTDFPCVHDVAFMFLQRSHGVTASPVVQSRPTDRTILTVTQFGTGVYLW